jgi:hypothetical protein
MEPGGRVLKISRLIAVSFRPGVAEHRRDARAASHRASFDRRSCALLLALLSGCSTPTTPPAKVPSSSLSVEAAEAARATLASRAPTSFKMLHQVVVKYQGQSYLMTGYMLGRKDGSFRVSATAAFGPKLFDVSKVGGHWESHVYLESLAKQLDATNVGRSVERIYFFPATGRLRAESGSWLSTASIVGEEEIDTVEDWRDAETLALRRKRYFKGGTQVVQVDFDKLELVQGNWLARSVHLGDSRGFSLELKVTGYEPGFPVSDDLLRVQSPASQ